jgi:hypothetical protein
MHSHVLGFFNMWECNPIYWGVFSNKNKLFVAKCCLPAKWCKQLGENIKDGSVSPSPVRLQSGANNSART